MKITPTITTPLLELYAGRKTAIRRRLADFKAVEPESFFYELAYCLLTPQSSAVNAARTIEGLMAGDFQTTGFDPAGLLRSPHHYVRFHNTKALRLLELRARFADVAQMLASKELTAVDRREWLVEHVKGIGYKEATHFLRNIGRNDGLAILDRHILRNLKRYGALRSIPATLSTRTYLRIERRFQEFAAAVGIPLDELDLLFWSMETGEILK